MDNSYCTIIAVIEWNLGFLWQIIGQRSINHQCNNFDVNFQVHTHATSSMNFVFWSTKLKCTMLSILYSKFNLLHPVFQVIHIFLSNNSLHCSSKSLIPAAICKLCTHYDEKVRYIATLLIPTNGDLTIEDWKAVASIRSSTGDERTEVSNSHYTELP